MKKLVLAMVLLFTGCTSSTPHGQCVGINGVEDPKLRYEYNATNIVIGVIFMEMVVPPVIVVLNELKCPVAVK